MLGIKFIRIQPTQFVLQYKSGKIVREGAGLAFFYYAPTSSLVLIPVGSTDVPFIIEEVTADFQQVTVQGQLTFRVTDPKKLSVLMNYTLSADGSGYTSDDPKRLAQRLVSHVQVLTRSMLQSRSLREALGQSDKLVSALREGLESTETISSLGVQILGLSILAIKPTPETAHALEAEARERLLREADEAIYARRNAAIEQERAIKESELNTEIAVENKKRQIQETQMSTRIALEQRNKELVALAAANARAQADAKAYAISASVKAVSETDPKVLQALAMTGMDASRLVALAFKEIAEGADKIGQLNVSPDLLRELLAQRKTG